MMNKSNEGQVQDLFTLQELTKCEPALVAVARIQVEYP